MKNNLLGIVMLAMASMAYGQDIAIIPEPVSVKKTSGAYVLPKKLNITVSDLSSTQKTVNYLRKRFTPTGCDITVIKSDNPGNIHLALNGKADPETGNEGYKLSVTESGVKITANAPAGLYYGVQTLLQLMPKEIENTSEVKQVEWKIPAVEITDYPRFGWRGLMFDVARHFFTKEEVKRFIDDMAKYKFNLLHLHLADDEGWRIEIKSYPKLTEVGAWNVKREGYFGTFIPPSKEEPRDYGGFFTQEDIKEIVQYALDNYINIMPEIDVPGHSLAAIASYPELSCTPEAKNYNVRSGEKIIEWHGNGKFTALIDNTLCPANEKVYEFLDKVVSELAELFPFEYIHMGGDECAKDFWINNPQIKALMQRENLKTMEQVQGYFTKRVQQIVSSKGKKMIGWDEILEGGISPETAIMSWRGVKGGIEAAKHGHEVVMSPTTFAYLDYMQGDVIHEPRVYASLRLKKAYEFDPLPEGVDPKFIKGGQGNLWTEQIYNLRHAQYMLWPRAFAIAESVWSQPGKKQWDDFTQRMEAHLKRLDEAETKYATSAFEPIIEVSKTAGNRLMIKLSTEVSNLNIHYTFDNSFPDHYYPVYKGPLIAPIDAVMLRVVTYRGKEQKGRIINIPISELKNRAGIK